MRSLLCLVISGLLFGSSVEAQPQALVPGLTLRPVLNLDPGTVRIGHDPTTGDLYHLKAGGEVYRVEAPFGDETHSLAYTSADHGLGFPTLGLTLDQEGTLYLVGNIHDGPLTTGVIVRGVPQGEGGRAWSTVAQTEPYPRSETSTDHLLNGIAVSPDGAFLFVNSGSRTDHGEEKSNEGTFPGLRESPITSAILRIPSDADALLIPNDEALLASSGLLFADGVRNSFDLAFDAAGRLFATENSGDRDDGDELNWIREGHHYGFPWRMGSNATPQQFAGYDPDSDPLVNPLSPAYANGWFYDDPSFPAPPDGITFTDPVLNVGPDADRYRDAADGSVHDASELGEGIATFTPHRSPLGLAFDDDEALPGEYTGDGFVLSWTSGGKNGSPLLIPFGDESEDLLHIDLSLHGEAFEAETTRLVRGFGNPIDAVFIGTTLYVAEFGGANQLWAVTFEKASSNEPSTTSAQLDLDVFPNPVRSGSRATVRVEGEARVTTVEVVNVLGGTVKRLYQGALPAGGAQLLWDTTSLPGGIYLVRLKQGATSRTSLVTVVR